MSTTPFGEFFVTDLAHASVFNTKVRVPGEAVRATVNQHVADKTNPHDVTWDQTGAAEAAHDHAGTYAPTPHNNTHHSETYLTAAAITGKADNPHGNAQHSPNMVVGNYTVNKNGSDAAGIINFKTS